MTGWAATNTLREAWGVDNRRAHNEALALVEAALDAADEALANDDLRITSEGKALAAALRAVREGA